MTQEKNFGALGTSYQPSLLKTIFENKQFASIILEILDPHYFEGGSFRYITQIIKDYFEKYKDVPGYDNVIYQINNESQNDTSAKMHLDTIAMIKNLQVSGSEDVMDKALDFCRQQNIKKELKTVNSIIERGDFGAYPEIEEIIKKALLVGSKTNKIIDPFENIKSALEKDARVPIPTGIKGIDECLKQGLAIGELGVLLAPTGVGKAEPISEPLLTPKGWIKMGDVKIGDEVIGSDGKKQYVIGVYPQGIRPIYKVEFSDNTFVNCDEEHLWSVNTLNMRTAKTRLKGKGVYKPNNSYVTLRTSDMVNNIKKRGRYNYRLPTIEPVEFESKNVTIDPYLLGVLIGDGYLPEKEGPRVSTKDDEIFDNISNHLQHTGTSDYIRDTKTITVIRFKKSINKNLSEYGLIGKKSNDKFIPKDYIYNTIDVRINILQGLMDTDGYVSKNGITQFTTVSKQLASDVRELVLSLGGTARLKEKQPTFYYKDELKTGQKAYTITMSFGNGIIPFKLTRKVDRYRKRGKYINQKFIKSISYSHDEEAICIKVSNPDELYVTSNYVLTHNTTMITKFANSAYSQGFKVLQIIFEDNVNNIIRKHCTIWTGIAPDDLPESVDDVIGIAQQIKEQTKGELKICKLPSDSVTISEIKALLRRLAMEGFKPDLVLIDYVDCIVPEKSIFGEEWKGEGNIMRHLEAMTDEFNIAIWVATQGNRESIGTEVVTTDLMGGSIKKAFIGHVVISVGKTLEQKEQNFATISILKSRIGKDGVVFQNCYFNNEMLEISTESRMTLLGHEQQEEEKKKQRPVDVYREAKKREAEVIVHNVSISPNLSFLENKDIKNIVKPKPTPEPHETTLLEYKKKKLEDKANAARERLKQQKPNN